MFHSLVRRASRQTGGPPKRRSAGFAVILVVSFIASAGAAIATENPAAEGGIHNQFQNADWGHLIGHDTTNDCLYMSHSIKTARNAYGVTAAPELYTYGSVDGSYTTTWSDSKTGQSGTTLHDCAVTNKTLPRQQLGVQQSLAHWLTWMNNWQGGWAWCNNGPWVYNIGAAYDHDAVTGYTWVPWPCQDQSANGADNWFFGYHYIWAGPTRIGGEVYIPAVSDWIQVYMS